MVGEQIAINATKKINGLFNNQPEKRNEPNKENETAQQSEYMHRFFSEVG